MSTDFFTTFSVLLDYPVTGVTEFAQKSATDLKVNFTDAAELIQNFADSATQMELYELEELYTRTFDIQGRACLDIGYLLFGEDYKRGEFLVTIQRLAKEHEVKTGVELPDHITNILRLLSKMNEGSRRELCEKVLMPALEKLLNNFSKQITGEDLYVSQLLALRSYLNNKYVINKSIFGAPVC